MHARCLQGEAPRMPVRALICHEDIFIRAGIRAIIEKSDNIIVVGEFASAEELISGARCSARHYYAREIPRNGWRDPHT